MTETERLILRNQRVILESLAVLLAGLHSVGLSNRAAMQAAFTREYAGDDGSSVETP